MSLRALLLGVCIAAGSAFAAHAQTAAILPNAMTQFADGNGAPYAGGRVFFYIPATTTPKQTWQDPNQIVPNTNPVVLDANGRGIIWGNGLYREILQDQFGNTIWDQITYNVPTSGAAASIPSGMVSWFNLSTCPVGWQLANGVSGSADVRGRYVRDLDQGTGRDPTGTGIGGAYASQNGPVTATTADTGTLTTPAAISGITGTVVLSVSSALAQVGTGGTYLTSATTGTSAVTGATVSGGSVTSTGTISCTNCGTQTRVDTVVLLACQKE